MFPENKTWFSTRINFKKITFTRLRYLCCQALKNASPIGKTDSLFLKKKFDFG
jgi:hypothetical protein